MLDALASWLAFSVFGLEPGSRLGEAARFFLYDIPKVFLLLVTVVFVMGVLHTWISPERTRAWLAGKPLGLGNLMAAGLGIVTPFCSCSAVPLFIGFLSAGVPLGVTFSFLISAPMVNEVALALLFGLFGWQVAALYLGLGLAVAIVAGLVIGRMGMEHHLEDWVRTIRVGAAPALDAEPPTWRDRLAAGLAHVREIVGRVWPWLIAGIAVGAGIHGYVPADLMAGIMGRDQWWAVPAAVLRGVAVHGHAEQ
ncbi:MAG: permease, partial [Thiobacillus sp.]|nr:permease [Thiobacillus sp.]